MTRCKHLLPGFRASYLTVSALYVLLGGAVLARGTRASMAVYGVPEATLRSAHYDDAIRWVYLHMVVLGALIGVIGLTVEEERARRWTARTLFAAHVVYTALDARSSESLLGNGLYRGSGSIGPAIVGLFACALFAHLSLCQVARSIGGTGAGHLNLRSPLAHPQIVRPGTPLRPSTRSPDPFVGAVTPAGGNGSRRSRPRRS